MTRLRARAPRGQRSLRGSVPRNRGKNTALIASMTLEGAMGASAMAVEGSTRAFVFEAYVEERFLAPSLRPGQIVVMDKLGSPQDREGERADRGEGVPSVVPGGLLSPDLNPIEEEAFSKVKAHLRKAAARTREALVEAMGEALSAVTPQDDAGWFVHCGYGTQVQSS